MCCVCKVCVMLVFAVTNLEALTSFLLLRGWLTSQRPAPSLLGPSRMLQTAPYSSKGGRSPASQRKGKHPANTLDQAEVLTVINEYRRQHGAPSLQWSEACAREAQKRASHRAGSSAEFGENLSRSTNPAWRDETIACVGSIHKWQVRLRLCVTSRVYRKDNDVIDRKRPLAALRV